MTLSDQHVASEIRCVLRSSISNCALHVRGGVVAVFVSLLIFVSPATCDDDENVDGGNRLDALRVKMEDEIQNSANEDQFIKLSDLRRLYINLFPYSIKSEGYLAELEQTKRQLIVMGEDAIGEKGLLSGETAFYLGSHCYIFPNSPKSIEYYERMARAAERAEMPALELELRARMLAISKSSPGYDSVRELATKAEQQNQNLVAINGLEYFQKGEYEVDGYENLNLGPSLMLSGDIYRRAHLFNRAISKYSEAIQWCDDMQIKTASRIPRSEPFKISNENWELTFSEGGDSSKVALSWKDGILRIENVQLSGMPIAKMLEFVLATIERNANILIGRAMIEDARSKTRGTSTSGFAGKLYEKAVGHFSALLEPMSLNDYSAMPYRLELLTASIELARYKKSLKHDGQSEAVNDYSRCIRAAESYLRMVSVSRTRKSVERGNTSFMEAEAAGKVKEVAFVLIEALIEIGREGEAVEVFNDYFADPEMRDQWAVFAMLELAIVHIDNRDYLRALPFFTAINKRGGQLGVRDLAFIAGLMKGVCIRRLGSVKERSVMVASRMRYGRDGELLPRSIMANNEYRKSVEMFKSSGEFSIVRYPEKYRSIFIDEIRAEVVMEFNSSRNGGGLVEALSVVDPGKAQGGLVASLSDFDINKVVGKGRTISDDGKQFGGFHASVIAGARVFAIGVEGEIDDLQWNPFNERVAK